MLCSCVIQILFQLTALQSLALSEDLKLIYPSQSPTHNYWEQYEPLVLKLRSFIPTPLTYSQLVQRDPHQITTQDLLSIIYEELCVHNSALISLHASLDELFTFLKGDALFTARIGVTLSSIRDNSIPAMWKTLLPFPLAQSPELMLALNLLRCRMEFYTRVLEVGKDNLPSSLEPALFSNPGDVISRMLQVSHNSSQLDLQIGAKVCYDTWQIQWRLETICTQ